MSSFTPLLVDLPNIEPVVTSILGGGVVEGIKVGGLGLGRLGFIGFWYFPTARGRVVEWILKDIMPDNGSLPLESRT